MFRGEKICVCCKHPIVDETIEGDMTLEWGNTEVNFKKLSVGADSGCRNCAVILDAIVTFVGGEDRSFMQSPIVVHRQEPEPFIYIGEGIVILRRSDLTRTLEPSKSGVWNVKEFRALSQDTSSKETIRIIQEWKTSCMQHHAHCVQRLDVPLPKRILEIKAERVFLREQPGSLAPYACLSHCWGQKGPAIKLTASTVERLRDGLKTSDLPKTFRDAVEVCRQLGIYYVWIDALCILQDSKEDWKEAAATMGDIYENSHLTIAATASQDSNGGLFSSDRPVTRRLDKHRHLYVRKRPEYFPIRSSDGIPTSMPLLTRAWVYQERKLSQRTIHFGKHQVYWECQTLFASEDSREDKIWNKYATRRETPVDLDWGDDSVDHKKYWQKTVREYTALQMTYESDRLPALAAVVDRMSRLQRVDDVYVAGLWKKSILSDLLWMTQKNQPRPSRMAPSWSWASAQNSPVGWFDYAFTKHTKVVSLEYTVVGAANLGEVKNASIILMVPVLDLTGFDGLDPAEDDHIRWTTRFRGISKSGPIMEQLRLNNLKISHSCFCPDYNLTTANPPFECGCVIKLLVARGLRVYYPKVGGIVVQQTSKNPPEYRRIGFVDIYLILTKPEMVGENDEDLAWTVHEEEKAADIGEDITRLMLSLPMEEIKIV